PLFTLPTIKNNGPKRSVKLTKERCAFDLFIVRAHNIEKTAVTFVRSFDIMLVRMKISDIWRNR
ncbi:MAG: hypothetical protein RR501_06965, partial [Cloacibacillus sp.]